MAYKSIIEEMIQAKLLPVYDAGYISLNKQFLTIGINGLVEAAEYLRIPVGDNEQYFNFVDKHLGIIYEANKAAKAEYGSIFNTEFVPAESLGVKNAKWDKEDGYRVSRDCYNSYFFAVEDESMDPLTKNTFTWTQVRE